MPVRTRWFALALQDWKATAFSIALRAHGKITRAVRCTESLLRLFRRYLPLTQAILLVLGTANPPIRLSAQEFRATITGEVADSTGAAIAGATITAVNVDTRVPYSATSDAHGVYSLLYILPGTYTVTVSASSFKTMVYNKVVLDSAQQLGLNVSLQPGAVSQQVVVTAGSVDIDTVSATTGGVIDETKVENMPSTGLMVWDDVSFTEGIRKRQRQRIQPDPAKQCKSLCRFRRADGRERVLHEWGAG